MKTYIGINNLSKEAKKIYIGYNNKAVELPITTPPVSAKIYGAVWDGSADTFWTRTDDSVGWIDPNPYYAGMSGTPSSPCDDIMPWSGMVKSEDASAGTVVAIPKFYYKMGYASGATGLKIQIAPASNGADWATANGFKVSSAHMDRGDGSGERDVVYIGRYHCASDYKSRTGVNPIVSITRAAARAGIHALGSTIWQNDFALLWTIRMLYLVEFADWNSQAKIGYGCGNNSSIVNMGYTDSMPYHTGTDQTAFSTYGGTQYRNIEGLWDNCWDWIEGINFNNANMYAIKNPSNFSDTYSDGVLVGTRSTTEGYASAFSMPSATGYEYCLFPNASSGSSTTYITDATVYAAGEQILAAGGNYGNSQSRGMFYFLSDHNASFTFGSIGTRLMILP